MENLPFIQTPTGSDSKLSRIDPRLKLLAFGVLAVLIGIRADVWSFGILTIALLLWVLSLSAPWTTIRRLVWPLALMIALAMLLHLLFGDKSGSEMIRVLGISVTDRALTAGLLSCWRILLFFMAALCFTLSMTPDQFAAGLWRLLEPSKRLRVPVDEIGLTIFIAIRFIPEIMVQYRRIALAQRIRGADFGGGLIARVRKLVPLLVPVTVAVFRRSNTLADCLTVRGWGVRSNRSYYGRSRFTLTDYCFAVTLLAVLAIVLVVRV